MYEVKPIYPKFKQWLNDKINIQAGYVISHVTKDLTAKELFEALVPEEYWKTLRAAAELMLPERTQSFKVSINYMGSLYSFNTTFIHKPASYVLLPRYLNHIEPNTKLMEYVTPAFSIACDWMTLRYVVSELIKLIDNRQMLSTLFPWLPALVRDSGWKYMDEDDITDYDAFRNRQRWYDDEMDIKNKPDRINCDRTFRAVLNYRVPTPPLAASVREAIALGDKLFTQYRLLKQENRTIEHNECSIIPSFGTSFVSANLIKGLVDTKQIFEHEKYTERQRIIDAKARGIKP